MYYTSWEEESIPVLLHYDIIQYTYAAHHSTALCRRPGEDESLPVNAKQVARSFRYMRRKPTIMAYRTPAGKHPGVIVSPWDAGIRRTLDVCRNYNFMKRV